MPPPNGPVCVRYGALLICYCFLFFFKLLVHLISMNVGEGEGPRSIALCSTVRSFLLTEAMR